MTTTSKKCDFLTCDNDGERYTSAAPGTALWVCGDHFRELTEPDTPTVSAGRLEGSKMQGHGDIQDGNSLYPSEGLRRHWREEAQKREEAKKPRVQVREFADRMEAVLKENDYKGGWQQDHILLFISSLKEQVWRLEEAVARDNKNEIDRRAINAANYLMFIIDNTNSLESCTYES